VIRSQHKNRNREERRSRRFRLVAWLALCGSLVAITPALAEDAEDAEDAEPNDEVRDTILMLETGPLHIRVHVAMGGVSPASSRQAEVDKLMKELDTDGDGKLSREESQKSPLLREKQRPGAQQFIKSIGATQTMTRKDIEKKLETRGGETVVYRQNTNSSETDDEVFKLLDADANGVLTEVEMFNAVDLLLAKDGDDDECVTLDEFAPPPDPNAMPVAIVGMQTPRSSEPSISEILRDTQQTLLPAQLLRKYDKDRNKKLSAEELGWTAERIQPCDANNDGQLDQRELTTIAKSPTDVELAVDLMKSTGQPMLRVISAGGERVDGDKYPDFASLKLPTAILNLSVRDIDPFKASMDIALRVFNELDVDANGYLDKDETAGQERFGRGLFDQIDADGDGKIFGEEMKAFVSAGAQPKAMTCQVTAFDDGAGFFGTLDSNGDSRISMREMRYADKSLANMERDSQAGIAKTEPARHYRIEFVRGVFMPVGAPSRAMVANVASTPSAPRAVGPIWFQRWDRNNDGDITWREFLGPRDAFEQLDADRDDLIDPKEADAASRFATERPVESRSAANFPAVTPVSE
jgi:Ca2+-binding EF-hand superfamily protein